jgi:hypothetical protein
MRLRISVACVAKGGVFRGNAVVGGFREAGRHIFVAGPARVFPSEEERWDQRCQHCRQRQVQ